MVEDLALAREQLNKANADLGFTNETLKSTVENLKATQDQLIQAEKMASLGELTAGIAHEINNPINFVSANIQPLKDDLADILKVVYAYDDRMKEKKLEKEFSGLPDIRHDPEIKMRDAGAGMKDEVRKKIFDPFFTTKEVGKGTGLGLSISYGIVEKHHGDIAVFSKPGEGTEFIVSIPIQQSLTV